MATIEERKGKKGKTYTARVRYKGYKFTETFDSKTRAKDWAKAKEVEINEGRVSECEATKQTLNDLLDEYEINGFDKKPGSFDKQKMQLKFWRSCLGGLKLNKITPAKICRYRRILRNKKTNRSERRSPATVNRYVSALSGALSYAVEELNWLSLNPAWQVKRLSESPPPIRFLNKETELPKLAEACGKSKNPRLLALFMIAVGLGLRANALLWLHRNEVDLEKRTIRIPAERSKNKKAFTLGISDVLYPYVKYLCDNCHPESKLLFPAQKNPFNRMEYRDDWDEALKLAGIENYRFHDNRHTCGSYLAMSGHSLAEIAELLNHKTLEMAKRYSHLADEYREKLSGRMHGEFISETSVNVVHLLYTNSPAIEIDENEPLTAANHGRPHLRLL